MRLLKNSFKFMLIVQSSLKNTVTIIQISTFSFVKIIYKTLIVDSKLLAPGYVYFHLHK